jgi:hypothetical protein
MLFIALDRKEKKSEICDLDFMDDKGEDKKEDDLLAVDDNIIDNTPVALKLMITNKNPDVLRRHVIDQEQVYIFWSFFDGLFCYISIFSCLYVDSFYLCLFG